MDVIHMVDMADVVDDGAIPAVGEAKKWQNGVAFFLDETACIRCALCVIRCPTDAITMNRYGMVAPSVGRTLPKESIDDEIHLDLTVSGRKSIRPLPMYDPVAASGFKQLNGNGQGQPAPSDGELTTTGRVH
jgi:NAD-dependent dihydropyrimidine dehydrogenase PreA subunit